MLLASAQHTEQPERTGKQPNGTRDWRGADLEGRGRTPGRARHQHSSVVPNENITPVKVASAVGSSKSITKPAVWLRNGLCGPFPAIEEMALLYVPLASG